MKMLPPQNIDAEKSVLGAILTEQSVMLDIMEILRPEDFYRADHGLIFFGYGASVYADKAD